MKITCNPMSGSHSQSFWLLQRSWVTSPAPLSAAHPTCLLGSDWLHSTATAAAAAAMSGHYPMVLASLNCWGLLLQVGCTLTSSLSWSLLRNSGPASWFISFNHGGMCMWVQFPEAARSISQIPCGWRYRRLWAMWWGVKNQTVLFRERRMCS